jgi:hypothetical protein
MILRPLHGRVSGKKGGKVFIMADNRQLYFIQEHLPEAIFNGGIGNMDAEKIFLRNGVKPLLFPCHYEFSWKAKLTRLTHLVKLFCTLPRHSVVIFQHPLYAGMNKMLIKWLRYRRSIKIVCFIADINGIKNGNAVVLAKEIRQFNTYHYFIIHNEAMQRWLQQQVPGSRSAMIRFFDFLATPVQRTNNKSLRVAFAGNLYKSTFLEKMDRVKEACPHVHFNLYGPEVSAAMQTASNVSYKGVTAPYELPQVIEGAFGLVWDGEGVEGAEGSMGHYMQYITHHKTSLYIMAGMPLIVYEKAGSAALVKQYQIGITINSLLEIEEKIKAITDTEYRQMCNNLLPLSQQIASGYGLTGALGEIVKMINKD